MSSSEPSDHDCRNRESWGADAPNWVAPARSAWAKSEPSWGIWVPHGELIQVLRDSGLTIERLVEVRAPEGGTIYDPRWAFVTHDWARCWPSEEIWVWRKP
jgi:hypothetical protein